MKGISKLKDEARKHEQREEWDKAVKVYLQVLAEAESEDVELPLYNRVGDLYVRLGRQEEAVRCYEQAADRYAEAGLFNNAIALCNKALRYTPGRLQVLRRLGQFSASQGFFTDARSYLIQYAEKSFAAGETDAPLGVLTDYAKLSGDADVREFLGRKLHELGRTDEGLIELKRAYAVRTAAGDETAAATLRREILAIDPAALDEELSGGGITVPPPSPLPIRADQLPDLPDDPPAVVAVAAGTVPGGEILPPQEAVGEAEPEVLEGYETTALEPVAPEPVLQQLSDLEPAVEFDRGPVELPRLEGLDQPAAEARPDAALAPLDLDAGPGAALAELDAAAIAAAGVGPGEPELIPLMFPQEPGLVEDGLVLAEPGAQEAAEPAPLPPELEEIVAEDRPLPELEEPELVEDASPLPELEEPELLEDASPLPELEEPELVEDASPLPELEEPELVEDASPLPELEEPGLVEDASPLPELEEPELAEDASPLPELEEPELAEDASPLPELEEPEPVEDATPLPVLEDPELAEGVIPLPELEETESPEPLPLLDEPAEQVPADSAEYVDLRALIIEPEIRSGTRFRVGAQEPTGDEDEDFAELLSQFKRKVAENVEPGDAAAHYDLGLAFKDMGLLDEAISELQLAMQGGDMRLKVIEELGHCFLLKKEYGIAEKVLRRALQTPHGDELELLGVYYHLGRVYEELGKPDLARDSYERVLALDINFGDVSERIQRL